MNNPRLAARYAKSLLDLAKEQDKVSEVFTDVSLMYRMIKAYPDLAALLKSPVINSDKKENVLQAIFAEKVNPMTYLFIRLLLRKTRESNLQEILKAFIQQYNIFKEIHQVKITTAVPVSPAVQEDIIARVIAGTRLKNIELEAVVNPALIGGFKLELEDRLVDASILRDLNDVKKQFASNEYIQKLR